MKLDKVKYFFKNDQIFPSWLFFFRINVCLFALIHFISIQGDFNDFYSFNSYVYPDIINASYDHYSFTITSLRDFLGMIHINISYENLLLLCRYCYPFFLIMLMLGCFSRLSAVLSLLLQLLLIKSIFMYEYGVDYFTTISLFYCCIFPVGRIFSVDNKIFKTNNTINHKLFLNLLKAHLSIAYFFSGFEKLLGATWRNGEAVWKSLHSHNYYSLFDLNFLAETPFFHISGWATIMLEMLYPLFININKILPYWLIGIIGMHLFIAFFMGLFFFSGLMIILNITAFYMPYYQGRFSFKREQLTVVTE